MALVTGLAGVPILVPASMASQRGGDWSQPKVARTVWQRGRGPGPEQSPDPAHTPWGAFPRSESQEVWGGAQWRSIVTPFDYDYMRAKGRKYC